MIANYLAVAGILLAAIGFVVCVAVLTYPHYSMRDRKKGKP